MKQSTFFIACLLSLLFSQVAIAQTETLGAIKYAAPAGFAKTAKEHAVVFNKLDQAKGTEVWDSMPDSLTFTNDYTIVGTCP